MSHIVLAFRVTTLAALVVFALVIQGHGRTSSLWQRTVALGGAGLRGVGESLFPVVVFGDGWIVTTTGLAVGAISGAMTIQAARVAHARPAVQHVLGTCVAALGLAGAIHPMTINW